MNKKEIRDYLILFLNIILIVFLTTKFSNLFGSDTDWINQHTIIPDYSQPVSETVLQHQLRFHIPDRSVRLRILGSRIFPASQLHMQLPYTIPEIHIQKMIMQNNKTLSNILSPFYYMIIGSKDILPPYHYINKLHYT